MLGIISLKWLMISGLSEKNIWKKYLGYPKKVRKSITSKKEYYTFKKVQCGSTVFYWFYHTNAVIVINIWTGGYNL